MSAPDASIRIIRFTMARTSSMPFVRSYVSFSFASSRQIAHRRRTTIGHARDAGSRSRARDFWLSSGRADLRFRPMASSAGDNWKRPPRQSNWRIIGRGDHRELSGKPGASRSPAPDAANSSRTPPHSPMRRVSNDPEVLRAALIRESRERRRAECRADMQTSVVKLALDLLVREPDIEGFFGALTKTMVEEGESHACALWLLDEERPALRALDGVRRGSAVHRAPSPATVAARSLAFPCEVMAAHLFAYARAGRRPSSIAATIRGCRSRPRLQPPDERLGRHVAAPARARRRARSAG